MSEEYLRVEQSQPLCGEIKLSGAKNAVLVTIASLILTSGISILYNVPVSADVFEMILLLESIGAIISFDTTKHELIVNTNDLYFKPLSSQCMRKTRASILI